jgi:predicted transcriptional regulator
MNLTRLLRAANLSSHNSSHNPTLENLVKENLVKREPRINPRFTSFKMREKTERLLAEGHIGVHYHVVMFSITEKGRKTLRG